MSVDITTACDTDQFDDGWTTVTPTTKPGRLLSRVQNATTSESDMLLLGCLGMKTGCTQVVSSFYW